MSRLGFRPEDIGEKLSVSVGSKGCDIYLDGDTDTHSGNWKANWKAITVLADVTINSITQSCKVDSTIPTGSAIPAGTFISVDGTITSIKLTSGSVAMYR